VLWFRNGDPVLANSNLIIADKPVPIIAENNAKIKYNTAISLAFVENNHL
jgi:hypothetical protein